MIRWESAGATHVGRVRRSNEDSFRIVEEGGLFVVADGMGGHAAGEVASALAADTVLRYLSAGSEETPSDQPELNLVGAFEAAQREIVACCEWDPRTAGMGTTLTVALFGDDGHLRVGHLGDSRLYRARGGSMTQLTQDHTWVQQEVDAGRVPWDAARDHPLAHILTRVLTADDPATPDVITTAVLPGDTFLICTDGLHNHVDGQSILEILAADLSAGDAVARLIRAANRRGGSDNITAIVVRAR